MTSVSWGSKSQWRFCGGSTQSGLAGTKENTEVLQDQILLPCCPMGVLCLFWGGGHSLEPVQGQSVHRGRDVEGSLTGVGITHWPASTKTPLLTHSFLTQT